MRKYFFEPFVGENYLEGIRGKKILVVGASFYCNESSRCQFFKDCTDVIKKDSSAYDTRCEFNGGYPLRQEPEFNIGNHYRAYEVFGSFMQKISGDTCYADVWNRMAFTNYVQFFLPANDGRSRPTYYTDTSDRDFDAFIEIVKDLSPDIVIVWGCAIASAVKEDNKYLVDNGKKELEDQNIMSVTSGCLGWIMMSPSSTRTILSLRNGGLDCQISRNTSLENCLRLESQ